MKLKQEATPWELDVKCTHCSKTITLKGTKDIFRSIMVEKHFPNPDKYGRPEYNFMCPECKRINTVPAKLIRKDIRNQTRCVYFNI